MLSTGKARGTPGSCHHSQSPPDVSVHSREPGFPALPRHSSRGSTHATVARGSALWKSLVGKPRGKDTDHLIHAKGSATLLLQLGRKAHVCPHSRRGLTPLGRLQTYPKINVSTGDEFSGSDPDSTQGLSPWYRWETNPERPPSNLHEDWTLLSLTDLVPDIPLVTRAHLSQLNNIQEVLPSRRDEALFR